MITMSSKVAINEDPTRRNIDPSLANFLPIIPLIKVLMRAFSPERVRHDDLKSIMHSKNT